MRWKKTIVRLFLPVGVCLCASTVAASDLDSAIALFRQNKVEESRILFKAAHDSMPDDPTALAWLAECHRRLGNVAMSVVLARQALALEPCHGFANMVLADAFNPQYGKWDEANLDSCRHYTDEAVRCDPEDGNIWSIVWVQAVLQQDVPSAERALRMVARTGFLTPPALAYYRWVLEELPPDAILVTSGDIDTYCTGALQAGEGLRSDIAIVNQSLLNLHDYIRFVRDYYDLPLPSSDSALLSLAYRYSPGGNIETIAGQVVGQWMLLAESGDLKRPLITATSEIAYDSPLASRAHFVRGCGVYYWQVDSADSEADFAAIRHGYERFPFDRLSGAFVSDMDRSPIRWVAERGLVTMAAIDAYRGAAAAGDAGDYQTARWLLNVTRRIVTELNPDHVTLEDVQELEDSLPALLHNETTPPAPAADSQ